MANVLQTIISVHGHHIRLTAQQWAHITESHDYIWPVTWTALLKP